MSILRVHKATVDELIEQETSDLFSLDYFPQPEPRSNVRLYFVIGLIAISLGVTSFAITNLFFSATKEESPLFAYFEIKAIDSSGKPIPGATVSENAKSLGVTDSFGEWRRFLKVTLGEERAFSISKRSGSGEVFTAKKNMAVPAVLPAGAELELTGSIQLDSYLRSDQNTPIKQVKTNLGDRQKNLPPSKSPSFVSSANERDAAAANGPFNLDDAKSSDAMAKALLEKENSATGFHQEPLASDISFSSLSLNTDDPGLEKLLAHLKARSLQLGLPIDPGAAWEIKLSRLETQETSAAIQPIMEGARETPSGLIMIESFYRGERGPEKQFSYLRNELHDPLQTARDILWSLTQHIQKAYRVVQEDGYWVLPTSYAPIWQLQAGRYLEDAQGKLHKVLAMQKGGWILAPGPTPPCIQSQACDVTTPRIQRILAINGQKSQRLRLYGDTPRDTEVFVSGYQALPHPDGSYEYWAKKGSEVNVTLVSHGQLLYRERLSIGAARELVVSLPKPPISRR